MDGVKSKAKKGLILKTWERCRSFGGGKGASPGFVGAGRPALTRKSKSWSGGVSIPDEEKRSSSSSRRCRVAPEGCFSVYVGPEKQRFVIKTEYVNHPLFKMLLEEAASEYGFHCEGPLVLPCDVDHFVKVLLEMDTADEVHLHGCAFAARNSHSYHLLTPPRFLAMNKY